MSSLQELYIHFVFVLLLGYDSNMYPVYCILHNILFCNPVLSIEYTEDRFVCVCAHARSWVSLCVHERMEWGWRGQSSRLLALSISIFLLFCCFHFVLFWNKISHDLEITESDWLADHLNPGELLGISVMNVVPVSIVTILGGYRGS